jgi:hypothetical protein
LGAAPDFGVFAQFAFGGTPECGTGACRSAVPAGGADSDPGSDDRGGGPSMAPLQTAHRANARSPIQPVIASGGGVWRERYSSCCESCYRLAAPCPHYTESPLTLLIVGHNPSEHTWSTGYPYSNPSNRFWSLLVDGGVLPAEVPAGVVPGDSTVSRWTPAAANRLPDLLGIGITDVGCEPGSEADKYPRATMLRWRDDLYARLRAHRQRAGRAPLVVAFSGVRQWSQLFEPPLKRLPRFGRQHAESDYPPRWPYKTCDTAVFVLPSSSGRAVFTKEERLAPYRQLGEYLSARRREPQQEPQQELQHEELPVDKIARTVKVEATRQQTDAT